MVDRAGRGKADAQDVLPGFQDFPHLRFKFPHVDGGGSGQRTIPDTGIELLKADVPAVQIIAVGFALHLKAQRQNLHAQFCRHFGGEVTAAVR